MHFQIIFLISSLLLLTACPSSSTSNGGSSSSSRLVQFIGVDISGSFKRHRKDALRFTARYIYAHLHGLGKAKVPKALFVGSIGGARPNEPKTFYPIEVFKYKNVKQIERKLMQIFPRATNPMTDYNAFFNQIKAYAQQHKLTMKPISIVLLTDGIPDTKTKGKHDYCSFNLKPLELLSNNITVRVLYTSAGTGLKWQQHVPRTRVRVWTQDANVMKMWKSPDIMQKGKKLAKQDRFLDWLANNVDFKPPKKKVICKS